MSNDSSVSHQSPLHTAVKKALKKYCDDLNGEAPSDMYQLVLEQVEQPMLEVILAYTEGNQTKAADYLGINRGTLRKKLRQYGLE